MLTWLEDTVGAVLEHFLHLAAVEWHASPVATVSLGDGRHHNLRTRCMCMCMCMTQHMHVCSMFKCSHHPGPASSLHGRTSLARTCAQLKRGRPGGNKQMRATDDTWLQA